MFPTLGDAASGTLDQVLDRLRIRLLGTAAQQQQASRNPGTRAANRCHATGAPTRGTDTAA